MEIVFRYARTSESNAIIDVLFKFFLAYRDYYTEEAFRPAVIEPGKVEARMNEGKVWVAQHNSDITGTISGIRQTIDYYLRGMAVLPEFRGNQVGLLLLATAESHAASNGCTGLNSEQLHI